MVCQDFASCVTFFISLANPLFVLLVAVAVLLFMWGIVRYIYASGTSEKSDGRTLIFWGIIALVVMVSFWGIVLVLTRSFLS